MNAVLAAFLCFWSSGAWAESTTTLKDVDVYRSGSVTAEQLRELFGRKLQVYAQLHGKARPASVRSAARLKAEMEQAVSGLGDFAFVELFLGRYLTSAERSEYITFDIVERREVAARMPFAPKPAGKVPDPAGLLAAWQDYSALGARLRAAGAVAFERPPCPAYHCLWGSVTPELAAYEQRFMKEAAANKDALFKVLAGEADAGKRAAAVYVLAYVRAGKPMADLMLKTLDDPSPEVRSAALQVLADMAVYHKDVFIEANKLLPALDYPTVSDRSKALAVLVGLSDDPNYAPYLRSRAAPRLLELLKQRQPNVHDLSYAVLGILSKESFDSRDYKAWQGWVLSQSTAPASVPAAP